MTDKSLPLEMNAISTPRDHYNDVWRDTLRILWAHKVLIAAVLGVALVIQSVVFMLIAPRYTSEAMIHLDFIRDEPATGEKVQSTASVDATAVVTSAARILRSRGTASAVVSALRLDNDPIYTRLSLPERVQTAVRGAFGLPALAPHDIAVDRLMRQITVTNDPRSYLITVGVTAGDPERAARLANWIASEYLRGRQLQRAIEAYAAAEREMTMVSSVFGPRHPKFISGSAKLERLKAELAAEREGAATKERGAGVAKDLVMFAAGQSLLPAQAVMAPSEPNPVLFFTLSILAALTLGIMLSLLTERGMIRWSIPLFPVLRARWRSPLAGGALRAGRVSAAINAGENAGDLIGHVGASSESRF
jgi:capsular polysaccharide biosynthesis protein